jgi:16S rRNA (guanine527-N7)-methyltransferase
LPAAMQYAEFLCTAGLERGLLGPRETSVIWQRHLLNCAVVAELIPTEVSVVDVGSGAGLPGIPLALVRPDLRVTLLEPLQRRVTFLDEVVERLGLGDQVTVSRGRAEPVPTKKRERATVAEPGTIVVARAVAALDKLVDATASLIGVGGALVAIRGERAPAEVADAQRALRRAGLTATIVSCGTDVLNPPTTVVRCVRG